MKLLTSCSYLNLNCETEGLYRVPGSGPQVKHWQRRFDTELDVDLLDERDLYDPNTIASMLKSWLRDLPTEIMPRSLQSSLAEELQQENADYQKLGQQAPQKLRDALSELPPFNYYLLFAITCHLSLLLSHKDKNKMDLHNLSICIGPCLNLERWLFNYLVGDWRRCWQGCFTEQHYLESEKASDPSKEMHMPSMSSSQLELQVLSGLPRGPSSGTTHTLGGDFDSSPSFLDSAALKAFGSFGESDPKSADKPGGRSSLENVHAGTASTAARRQHSHTRSVSESSPKMLSNGEDWFDYSTLASASSRK